MKTSTDTLTGILPADRRTPGRSGRLQSALASARERFLKARRRRLAIRDLGTLSDRQLDDIGIARYQIPEVVDGLLARNAGTGATASRATSGNLSVRCGTGCPA